MTTTENELSNEALNKNSSYFTITTSGKVSLHEDYRAAPAPKEQYQDYCGNGAELDLPSKLIIPENIGGTLVTDLAPGMFYRNNRVREIVLPTTITTIPEAFCYKATNLRAIHDTEQITSIGAKAFATTRIKEALFPNLETLDVAEMEHPQTKEIEIASGAFANCAYLETVNIGKVKTVPMRAFYCCALLREVIGGENVSRIEKEAFFHTRSLRELPLLAHVTNVEADAFYYSRICTSLPANRWVNSKAFPAGDNCTDFWTGVEFTPCRNRITTKLSQLNPALNDKSFLLDKPVMYHEACALFAVMHIHSGLSGTYYSHPEQFVSKLTSNPKLNNFLYYHNWPGYFENVAPMFEALGYRAEVRGSGTRLSKDDYRALVDALAHGAYIYAQVPTYSNWEKGKYDRGHAVVIYGINDLGEVCVLDSNILHEPFRDGGFEPYVDIYTYTMPYQNMVGSGSDFVIVYPTKDDPDVKWTGSDAVNAFTSASRPSEYPESRVTVCRVARDKGTPGSENGILTACRVGPLAYRTFIPDGMADFYLQIASLGKDDDKWMDWTPCNRKDFTRLENQIFSSTKPFELPIGVTASVVSIASELNRLPERKSGCLTAYHLFCDPANAREEWQPDGSPNLYVRHAASNDQWDNWYVFEPQVYNPGTENSGGQGQ